MNIKPENKEIGLRLQKMRLRMGLNQDQMAEYLGIDSETYKRTERGYQHISFTVLQICCEILNVPADYILYGKEMRTEELWEMIENSSDETKRHIAMRLLAYFTDIVNTKEG